MNFPQQVSGMGGAAAILMVLSSLAVTAFWIVIGWRAVRAHEQIARQHAEIAAALRELGRE